MNVCVHGILRSSDLASRVNSQLVPSVLGIGFRSRLDPDQHKVVAKDEWLNNSHMKMRHLLQLKWFTLMAWVKERCWLKAMHIHFNVCSTQNIFIHSVLPCTQRTLYRCVCVRFLEGCFSFLTTQPCSSFNRRALSRCSRNPFPRGLVLFCTTSLRYRYNSIQEFKKVLFSLPREYSTL